MVANTCSLTGSADDFLPRKLSLPTLQKAAAKCQGCDLYCNATHVVFGEGPEHARLMLIGEQPGDQEDLAGKPFVGPSGRVLNDALHAAGIDRTEVYVTNAVKHFKFELKEGARGKRRIHSKPNWTETTACKPWLLAELTVVKPELIVTLGATAAQTLLGKAFRLTQHRAEFLEHAFTHETLSPTVLATVHPSSLLRIPDREARHRAIAEFTHDLTLAAARLKHVAAT